MKDDDLKEKCKYYEENKKLISFIEKLPFLNCLLEADTLYTMISVGDCKFAKIIKPLKYTIADIEEPLSEILYKEIIREISVFMGIEANYGKKHILNTGKNFISLPIIGNVKFAFRNDGTIKKPHYFFIISKSSMLY